uniref:Dephospho-CoA kinase n=1 Tax=Arcella intermedia TaxID=1963864 RepID=A0A6B2LTC4_9EUKA
MKVLKNLGVPVIDADLLGHKAYEPGTPSFAKIVGAFGKEVVGENGKINRAVLGGKVFGSQNVPQMKKLTYPFTVSLCFTQPKNISLDITMI